MILSRFRPTRLLFFDFRGGFCLEAGKEELKSAFDVAEEKNLASVKRIANEGRSDGVSKGRCLSERGKVLFKLFRHMPALNDFGVADAEDPKMQVFVIFDGVFGVLEDMVIGSRVGVGGEVRELDPGDPLEDEVQGAIGVGDAGADDAETGKGIARCVIRAVRDTDHAVFVQAGGEHVAVAKFEDVEGEKFSWKQGDPGKDHEARVVRGSLPCGEGCHFHISAGRWPSCLKNSGFAFLENANLIDEVAGGSMFDEAFGWFMEGFVAEPEGAEMHGNECLCLELKKCVDRLLRVHMDIAFGRGIVSSDGKEGDFHWEAFPDFAEPLEICAVTAVEDRASGVFNMEATEAAMDIVDNPSSPVACGSESDFEVS